MALGPVNIPPLQERLPIVDDQKRPLSSFIRTLNKAFQQISRAFNEQSDIVQQLAELAGLVDDQGALIAAQQTQIDDLQTQQEENTSAASLLNSGVVDETGDLLFETTGHVTIASHTRQYGNPLINPQVSVASGGVTTGASAGQIVYIYYEDPARAGGSVTYLSTTDAGVAIQQNGRHIVGSGEVPSGLDQPGEWRRPI